MLRLEEGLEGDPSSGSDGEETGSGKKDKRSAGQDMDIQVVYLLNSSTDNTEMTARMIHIMKLGNV